MATIEPADVIRLLEQYLKENNLLKTLECLQNESTVSLNTVDSIETFVNDINSGHWDVVLRIVRLLKLPDSKLMDLYEHIAIELIELRETRAANWLIHKTEPMIKLKSTALERYLHLQNLLGRSFFDPREAYKNSTKEQRRTVIANDLKKEVTVVPPQRLLMLIGDALKWQRHEGLLPESTSINIFTGKAQMTHAEEETFPTVLHRHCVKPVSGPEGSLDGRIMVSCAEFSPDGHYLVLGYSTGVIEVRNPTTGRLANDLKYQASKNFIVTPRRKPAYSLCFSAGDMIAVGDGAGDISLWKLETGQLVQQFMSAHTKVSCLMFHRNGREILSGGKDEDKVYTVKLHGMRSNKTIREFKGHKSFIKALAFSRDDNYVLSGGSDKTVKIWTAKTAQLVHEYENQNGIHTILLMPNFKNDIFLIGDHSKCLQLIDLEGRVKTRLSDEAVKDKNSDEQSHKDIDNNRLQKFHAACASPKGNWVYAVDSSHIYCFNYSTRKVKKRLLAHEEASNDLIGVKHHPFLNLVATYDTDGNLKLWKP